MTETSSKKNPNAISKLFSGFLRFFQKLFRHQKSLIKAGATWQEVKLQISPEVSKYLEMRHVLEDEAKQVIYHAETTGEKLYQPKANKFLGKLKIGRVLFYVNYGIGDDRFIVNSAYTHRSEITG